jgi:Putative SAM-dependent methyltransferase
MVDTSFKLVKAVLDDLIALIHKKHPLDADDQIKKRIGTLSGEYKNLTSPAREPVDYSDPLTRFAYVYSYVAAHSAYVKQKLLVCKELADLLGGKGSARVTCVGGGPGSELVGVLQACMTLERSSPLAVWLLDREESWSETWSEIDGRLEAEFRLSANFRQTDVATYANFDNLNKAFSANLFVMSFFLSEIYSFKQNATNFFSEMVNTMQSGAMVLYVDNSSDSFTQYAEGIFKQQMFDVLYCETKQVLLPGNSEQTSDLEPYKSQFGWSPKIKSDATVRVWRKK